MKLLLIVLCVLLGTVGPYLLGCSNGSILVSKYILKNDIRTHGSGNAGLTNFYRVFGGGLTAVVILTDVLKAVVSVLLGMLAAHLLSGMGLAACTALRGKYVASLCCLLGHMYPVMFGFRGGKGILSGGTIALMIDWRIALVVWGAFLILAVATRFVSLGSMAAGLLFPFATWFVFWDVPCLLCAVVIGALILWKHRTNFIRLIHGKENKFTLHKKTS